MTALSPPPAPPRAPTLPRLPTFKIYAVAAEACVDLRIVRRYLGCAWPQNGRPNATNPEKILSTHRERIERALQTLKLERYLRPPLP